MSIVDITFRNELELLKAQRETLITAEGSFRAIWLSPFLFRKKISFVNRLNILQDYAVLTPKQASQIPFSPVSSMNNFVEREEQEEEEKPEKKEFSLNYPLAGLLGIAIIMTGIPAFYQVIPPVMLIYVIAGCLAVAASPYIIGFVKGLFRKEEEHFSDAEQVERAFAEIYLEYDKAWHAVVEQSQTKEELPDNQQTNLNEVLYNRERQEYERVSLKISELVGKIMGLCLQELNNRRELIYHALAASKQQQVSGA